MKGVEVKGEEGLRVLGDGIEKEQGWKSDWWNIDYAEEEGGAKERKKTKLEAMLYHSWNEMKCAAFTFTFGLVVAAWWPVW